MRLNTHAPGGSYEYAALLSTALADMHRKMARHWFQAIMKLGNSAQLRETLGEAGRETVRVCNRLSSFSTLFEGIYRECVSSRENAAGKQSVLTM